MAKIDEFKEFVKKNPRLVKYVKNGESNWQQFYEIYDLYGEDKEAWKDYLNVETVAAATTATVGVNEVFNWLKNINLDSVQSGVSNLQRVIGMVQDLSSKDDNKPTKEYKPRPMYKHFED